MVRRTKKLKGGFSTLFKYATLDKKTNRSRYPTVEKALLLLNPVMILYWILFQQGTKAVANFKLFTRILKSYKITKNKYQEQYNLLNDAQKKEFKYATFLIKGNYHQRVGHTYDVIKPTQDIMQSCDDIDSLDIQYRLMNSIHYKSPNDFNMIFGQNSNKFEHLYNNIIEIAKKNIQGLQGQTDNELETEKEKVWRNTRKLKNDKESLQLESDNLNKNIISPERAQLLIENLFKVKNNENKEFNYSYMITYILHDIYDNKSYIIKDELDNINYTHKGDCNGAYNMFSTIKASAESTGTGMKRSFIDTKEGFKTGLGAAGARLKSVGTSLKKGVVSAGTGLKDAGAKMQDAGTSLKKGLGAAATTAKDAAKYTFLAKEGNTRPLSERVSGYASSAGKGAIGAGKGLVKGAIDGAAALGTAVTAAALTGGYSKRRAPKKRIPTIKRLKVTR